MYLNDTINDSIDQLRNPPHYIEDIIPNTSRSHSRGYRSIPQTDHNERLLSNTRNAENVEQQQPGIFYRFVVKPLAYLGSFFCGRKEDTLEDENLIFEGLPDRVSNLNTFNTLIKTRIGMIVLYQHSDGEYFQKLVYDIKKEEYIMDIMVNNIVTLHNLCI